MSFARILDADRQQLTVFCQDGDVMSEGRLVVRPGGGVMFEADTRVEGTHSVRPGPMSRARILNADRQPLKVYCLDGDAIAQGRLVVRPGGGVLFEAEAAFSQVVTDADSAKEDLRAAQAQARAEGIDPRSLPPASDPQRRSKTRAAA